MILPKQYTDTIKGLGLTLGIFSLMILGTFLLGETIDFLNWFFDWLIVDVLGGDLTATNTPLKT